MSYLFYFESYKGRQVEHTQKVQVYRNLNMKKRGIVYSVRDSKSGLVLGHSQAVLLSRCKFHVSEKGRQRVIGTERKNIHAWIEGHYVGPYYAGWEKDYGTIENENSQKVYYDPWIHSEFTSYPKDLGYTECPVDSANLVLIHGPVIAHDIKYKDSCRLETIERGS